MPNFTMAMIYCPSQLHLCIADLVIQLVGFRPRLTENYSIKGTPIDLKIHPESGELIDVEAASVFGTILSASSKVLSVLRRELSLQIYADYIRSPELRSSNHPSKRRQKKCGRCSQSVSRIEYNPLRSPCFVRGCWPIRSEVRHVSTTS